MAESEGAEPTRADLIQVVVPISKLHRNPWNPNQQSERVYQAERESIREYGFIDPCTVWPHPSREGEYEIIDGEHRWRAARDEGHTELPVIVLQGLSEPQAKKLTIILNETRGEADVALLGRLLADLRTELDEDALKLGLPYTDGELKHLTELGAVDWDDFEANLAEPPPPLDAHSVHLVFGKKADVERFHTLAKLVQHEDDLDSEAAAALAALAERAERIKA